MKSKLGGMSMDHISVGAQQTSEGERFFFKVYLTTYFFDEITKIERATRGCYLHFFEGPKLYLTNYESVYLAARMGDAMETIPWQ
jgi:hypothetical protein